MLVILVPFLPSANFSTLLQLAERQLPSFPPNAGMSFMTPPLCVVPPLLGFFWHGPEHRTRAFGKDSWTRLVRLPYSADSPSPLTLISGAHRPFVSPQKEIDIETTKCAVLRLFPPSNFRTKDVGLSPRPHPIALLAGQLQVDA